MALEPLLSSFLVFWAHKIDVELKLMTTRSNYCRLYIMCYNTYVIWSHYLFRVTHILMLFLVLHVFVSFWVSFWEYFFSASWWKCTGTDSPSFGSPENVFISLSFLKDLFAWIESYVWSYFQVLKDVISLSSGFHHFCCKVSC